MGRNCQFAWKNDPETRLISWIPLLRKQKGSNPGTEENIISSQGWNTLFYRPRLGYPQENIRCGSVALGERNFGRRLRQELQKVWLCKETNGAALIKSPGRSAETGKRKLKKQKLELGQLRRSGPEALARKTWG